MHRPPCQAQSQTGKDQRSVTPLHTTTPTTHAPDARGLVPRVLQDLGAPEQDVLLVLLGGQPLAGAGLGQQLVAWGAGAYGQVG